MAATVTLSASNFPAGAHLVQGAGTTTLSEPHPNIDADPLFTDPLTGDYSLRDGSPAIDAAYSPPLAPDESPVDLVGAMRIQDGNGDGVAARDMGAFEHPAVPATTTSTTSTIPTTTSTTVPCETPRCLFDAAVRGPACAGVVPRTIRTRIDAVVRLTDRLAASSGRRRRQLARRTLGTLDALTKGARRAAKGDTPRIATACATALADAAATVGRPLR